MGIVDNIDSLFLRESSVGILLNILYPLTRRMPLLKITSACRTWIVLRKSPNCWMGSNFYIIATPTFCCCPAHFRRRIKLVCEQDGAHYKKWVWRRCKDYSPFHSSVIFVVLPQVGDIWSGLIWPNFGAPRWEFWPKILMKSQMSHICPPPPPFPRSDLTLIDALEQSWGSRIGQK